jgi:hypothetical protein
VKAIDISLSVYGEERVTKAKSAPVNVNLSKLAEFYSMMGEKHRENVLRFIDYWQKEAYKELFIPKAVLKVLPMEAVSEYFGSEKLQINNSVDKAVMAVWTIGRELEDCCSRFLESRGKRMDGFLLDVTGSIALYDMHVELIRYVRKYVAAPQNKFINGEFYPGIGNMEKDLMETVTDLGDTERLIGVSSEGNSLLKPRKSQCSFIALGSSEYEIEIKMSPCNPCSGVKCLYYQLGGCHMMAEGGPKAPKKQKKPEASGVS